ncbi:MAG TPA: PQQ-binding-like beta-propeller repeat protein [Mycobacteriales bacterium]|nr:PQQ-binding-like beta-propeller repeat protein [Mycobacteriales bacterium]
MSVRAQRITVIAVLSAAAATACGSGGHRVSAPSPSPTTGAAPVSTHAPTATASPAPGAGGDAQDQTFGYHRDAGHTGFDPLTPPFTTWSKAWSADLDGQVYGQPLVVGDHVIAITENSTVYALAIDSGTVVWHTHVTEPAARDKLPCGNIQPTVGITSTAAYDPASRRIFTVALTPAGSTVKHVLFALDAATGRVVLQRDIDPQAHGIDPAALNERGALAIANGRVYVPFGGNFGDCGSYRGAVVSSALDGQGPLTQFVLPTPREGGMWAPGGIAVDDHGDLYVSTGNGAVTDPAQGYDGSDSVIKLSPALEQLSIFGRAEWAEDNATDLDLGTTGPLLVGPFIWIQGKASTGYLLRQSDLGGVGHPFKSVDDACGSQFGGAAAHGLTIFASCTDGISQLTIGADGTPTPGWKAKVFGSPVVGGGVVIAVEPSSGTLYAFDEQTGAVRGQIGVGDVSHFATPALHDDLVLVPTLAGITAVRGA